MATAFELAAANLLSPMILFFALGLLSSLARSDLSVPEAVAKGLSLYLMLSIGFKGGVGVAAHGVDAKLAWSLLGGIALSAAIPLLAFRLLTLTTELSRVDAAAIAAHYGSISIVTFLAATQALELAGIPYEGFMVAVAAVMETPAIFVALWLAKAGGHRMDRATLREVSLNGSIVMLTGSFVIGWITGAEGMKAISAFVVDPFKGILPPSRHGHRRRPWFARGREIAAAARHRVRHVHADRGGAAGLVHGKPDRPVDGRRRAHGDARGERLVHRRTGGASSGASGSPAVGLSSVVARGDVPVELGHRNSALPLDCSAGQMRSRHEDLSEEAHRHHGGSPIDDARSVVAR